MDPVAARIFAFGVIALGFGALGVWQQVKGEDGSGWGLVALLLVITSCTQE